MQGAESELRLKFFDKLFGDNSGYLCIAVKNPSAPSMGFQQKFFQWPGDYVKAEEFIHRSKATRDVYFCVNLLAKAERKKEHCLSTNLVWADLDNAPVEGLTPTPAILIRSSTGRHQGIWRLSMDVEPAIAENYSKRVAYKFGADKSGWDLTQLLRVPYTFNHKYSPPEPIDLASITDATLPPLIFEGMANPDSGNENSDLPDTGDIPTSDDLPSFENVMYKFGTALRRTDFPHLIDREISPDDDWSKPLWKLIHICLEVGMDESEVLVVVQNSKIDKYQRDQRPVTHLWRDILKAKRTQENLIVMSANFKPILMPNIADLDDTPPTDSFVGNYKMWAEQATDAVPDFHDLSAYMLLSSIVANSVRLETSYGPMVPNIWGMILGDSTLTRKTTAMRMVMDILNTLSPETILATDGSAEGLLSGLEVRPHRTSIFFRDELSGFFDSINRKDYLAGMPEVLTHLYDVPAVYQRRLRKEIIRLESPVFIFFGGGVRDKVYEVSTEEYVLSGFLPRFLIVSGDADLGKLRRTGPANQLGIEQRSKLVQWAADLYEKYATEVPVKIGPTQVSLPPRIDAYLTDKAWSDYGAIEESMVLAGSESTIPHLALPTFERFSRSILKMAVLNAAARQDPKDNKIIVEPVDVKNAAWYGQKWGPYSIDYLVNTGKGVGEKILDKILNSIKRNPGILKSTLMQHHHLDKRDADRVIETLEERMLIQREKRGRGYAFWAV